MSMMGAITGVLASRGTINYEYFTTILYPFLTEDSLDINMPTLISNGSVLWGNPFDDMSIPVPTLLSGTLVDTIIYKTYNDGVIENVGISIPTLLSGTLVDTIIYVTYNDGVIENVGINIPELLSGTLE